MDPNFHLHYEQLVKYYASDNQQLKHRIEHFKQVDELCNFIDDSKCRKVESVLLHTQTELLANQQQSNQIRVKIATLTELKSGDKQSEKNDKEGVPKNVALTWLEQQGQGSLAHFHCQEQAYESQVTLITKKTVQHGDQYSIATQALLSALDKMSLGNTERACAEAVYRGLMFACTLEHLIFDLKAHTAVDSAKIANREEEITILKSLIHSLKQDVSGLTKCQATVARLKKEKAKMAREKKNSDKVICELKESNASLIIENKASLAIELQLKETGIELLNSQQLAEKLKSQISDVHPVEIATAKEKIKVAESQVCKLKQLHANEREEKAPLIASQLDKIRDLEKEIASDSVETKKKALSEIKSDREEALKIQDLLKLKLSQVEDGLKKVVSVNDELNKSLDSIRAKEKICPICLIGLVDLEANGTGLMALTICGHVVCCSCLQRQSRIKPVCPMCQTKFHRSQKFKLCF